MVASILLASILNASKFMGLNQEFTGLWDVSHKINISPNMNEDYNF